MRKQPKGFEAILPVKKPHAQDSRFSFRQTPLAEGHAGEKAPAAPPEEKSQPLKIDEALLAKLRSPDARQRQEAVEALGKICGAPAFSALVGALNEETDPCLRNRINRTMIYIMNEEGKNHFSGRKSRPGPRINFAEIKQPEQVARTDFQRTVYEFFEKQPGAEISQVAKKLKQYPSFIKSTVDLLNIRLGKAGFKPLEYSYNAGNAKNGLMQPGKPLQGLKHPGKPLRLPLPPQPIDAATIAMLCSREPEKVKTAVERLEEIGSEQAFQVLRKAFMKEHGKEFLSLMRDPLKKIGGALNKRF